MRIRRWVLTATLLGLFTSALPLLWARAAEDHASNEAELTQLQQQVARLERRVRQLERERDEARTSAEARPVAVPCPEAATRERDEPPQRAAVQQPERAPMYEAFADEPDQERGDVLPIPGSAKRR